MKHQRVLAFVALLALVASGCSSKFVGIPNPGQAGLTGVGPKGGATATPSPAPGKKQTTVALHVTIPNKLQKAVSDLVRERINARMAIAGHGRRSHPHYVSPSSAGVSVLVTQGATTIGTFTYNVTVGSPLCPGSGSSRTCTLAFPLAAGTYTLAMKFYDQAPLSGAIPVGANLLSEATISQTIIANTNNVLTFDLQGVIAGLSGNTFTSVPSGTAGTTAIGVVAVDADGNVITANSSHPYENPISVSLAGTTHATLYKNGTAAAGGTATLTYSTDTIAVSYDGGGTAGYGATTTLTSSGVTPQVAQISPLYVTGSGTFTDAGQTQVLTATEVNAPAGQTYNAGGWSCAGGFTKAIAGSGPSATFTITSPPATAGSALLASYACGSVTISDGSGVSPASPIPVSATIPIAPVCASSNTNIYIGSKSAGSYQTSTGSPCPFLVEGVATSPPTATIYAPPNDGTHPGSVVLTASEANDNSNPTVTGCTSAAGPQPGVANNMTPGATLTANLTGNVTVTQNYNTGNCTLVLHDNNGQPQTVPVSVLAPIQTSSASQSVAVNCTLSVTGPVGDQTYTTRCAWASVYVDVGGSAWGTSPTYTFTSPTNAVNLTMNVTSVCAPATDGCVGADDLETLSLYKGDGTYVGSLASGAAADSFSGVVALPSAGTYEVRYGEGGLCTTVTFDGEQDCNANFKVTATASAYSAAQGTGTVVPSIVRARAGKAAAIVHRPK